MALKYKNSKYLNYPGALQVTSSIPLDIRAVVANEKNLTDAETWYQDCSTATGVKIAYKGMLVSVEENNTVEAPVIYNLDAQEADVLPAWLKAVDEHTKNN